MWNAGLDEAQAGIKIAGRNTNILRCADDTTLMEESEEELKSLLIKVKEESEKVVLKLSIQKTKIMASGPITSWQIDGETMETVTDFIFLGSKITACGDCSHEIKRRLLLGRKAMTNLESILKKQRHYFANKGPSSQSYGFSSSHVWVSELDYKESWVPKNWWFWSVVLEKTLERQEYRGSAGEYQADEQARVARLTSRVSGRWAGRCRAAQLASIMQYKFGVLEPNN